MLARGREAGEQDGKTRDEAPLLSVRDDGSKRVSLVPPGNHRALRPVARRGATPPPVLAAY